MKEIFSYISNPNRFLKRCWIFWGIIFWFFLGASACKLPDSVSKQMAKLPPSVLDRLARLPYLGAYFLPQEAPEKWLKEAQKSLNKALWAGADIYAPKLFKEAQKYFAKGKLYLQEKRYIWARYFLKKASQTAEEAQKKSEKVRFQAQEERRQKLLALERELNDSIKDLSPAEKLNLQLNLKRLSLLIEEEKFKEFDQEWLALKQKFLKQKRGQKPPFTNQK